MEKRAKKPFYARHSGLRDGGGFTLAELLVTSAISTIVILTLGVILADTHRGWRTTYNRVYADVVTDSYVARRAFDRVVRKAGEGETDVPDGQWGDWLEVHYFGDMSSETLDRYARFYVVGGHLFLVDGIINPPQILSTQDICGNVVSNPPFFMVSGRSAQMILTLDDGSQTVSVTASAYMHNPD